MIGNAVPVNLAYHVAMQIRKTLEAHGIHLEEPMQERQLRPMQGRRATQLDFFEVMAM